MKTLSAGRIRAARAVAIGVDLIQIGFPYIFGPGFLSPFDDALDIATCLLLTVLVGWHIAFLPTFLMELLPLGSLAPSWTIAVCIATSGRQAAGSQTPPALPPPGNAPDPGGQNGPPGPV